MKKAPPGFTCPDCGTVSHNPNDVRQRYCARCHFFVDDPLSFVSAYVTGYAANAIGEPQASNPYLPDRRTNASWDQGWIDGSNGVDPNTGGAENIRRMTQ